MHCLLFLRLFESWKCTYKECVTGSRQDVLEFVTIDLEVFKQEECFPLWKERHGGGNDWENSTMFWSWINWLIPLEVFVLLARVLDFGCIGAWNANTFLVTFALCFWKMCCEQANDGLYNIFKYCKCWGRGRVAQYVNCFCCANMRTWLWISRTHIKLNLVIHIHNPWVPAVG